MDVRSAKRIGQKQTTIAAIIALLVAYLMMVTITGDSFWLFLESKNRLNIIGGGIFVILAALFIGAYTGSSILIGNKNAYWISIRNSFYILWLGTLLGACIGFFQEGIHDSFGVASAADDYILKPLSMVTMFGAIPTIIVAVILGWSIKRKRANKESK